MKKLIAISLTLVIILCACGAEPMPEPDPLAGWLESAKLGAEETPEQLYTAALEEDSLVIYSTSTRLMDTAASFEKEYPGLIVRIEHMREGEIGTQLQENYAARDFKCDLIVSSDGRGVLSSEFVPKNIAVKYIPYDIQDVLLPGNYEDLLVLSGEAVVLTYNDAIYPNPPVSNWWELTEEKWRGQVYIPNPLHSTTTSSFVNMIINQSELMAESYEAFYGEPLVLSEGTGGESAGREYVRRLIANDAVIVNSSDEVASAIGYPGSGSPSIGIIISSKTRMREQGYTVRNHYGIEPFHGIYTPLCIMMAGGAPNVNSAKLFIRWVLGEADGQGEGYKPYLQSGAWTVRSDVADGTGVRSEELNLVLLDKEYLYNNKDEFLAFWQELIEAQA